jgi:excisionase family DNA binding protein
MMLDATQSKRVLYTAAQRSPEAAFDNDLLTVAEVARLLKVPTSWVYERTRRRGLDRLPHFKLGKYLRFSEREIVAWLERIRGI